MNAVDGSEHYEATANGPLPSLLVIVLDTNPLAWTLLAPTIPFSKAIANVLIFINAHLAVNNANQVAVVASHSRRAVWLYPRQLSNSEDVEMVDAPLISENATKYCPFALIEGSLLVSLRNLLATTTEDDISTTNSTQMAGALTLALSYINKASVYFFGKASDVKSTAIEIVGNENQSNLQSRILVISVSGDLAHQYIPIMNTTFAAQRMRVPIDVCKIAGDTVFLQQASDATNGVFLHLRSPQGLLQYLMMAFLPDQTARKYLVVPTQKSVDFRAACFCHRKVVDVGFICSICLSIFCSPPENAICLTCSTQLALGEYGSKPAVVPRKKKKRKRINPSAEKSAAST